MIFDDLNTINQREGNCMDDLEYRLIWSDKYELYDRILFPKGAKNIRKCGPYYLFEMKDEPLKWYQRIAHWLIKTAYT